MSPLTIALFFVYTWGLGFTITRFVKESNNVFERNLMRIGLGLVLLPILIVTFSWLHIPLDWRIFLLFSAVCPIIYFILKRTAFRNIKVKLSKSNIYILIVLLLFLFTFFMYHKGAFSYPYLEDDDSWGHAFSAKYVSIEKTVFEPIKGKNTLPYMDAYSPSYTALMGILHQTSPSLSWTIKFFNALIISLGIIFFYFFVKEFIGNRNKALFSTFILTMIPCYLSHFIWSHGYVVTLIFPLFYCFGRMKYDKRWLYLSVLAIASTWLVQLTQSVKITVLIGIYWLCKSLTEKKLNLKIIMAEICGLFIAFIIWWGPMLLKYKGNFLTLGLGQYSSSTFKTGAEKAYFGVIGSAKGFYTFNDFFIAKHINRINNPIGVGVVICLLLVVSLLYIIFKFKDSKNKKEWWKFTAMLWLLFTFLGIHGGTRFPIAFWSFRFWMLFAIPMSILVSEGAWFLIRFIDGFNTNRTIKFLFRTVMLTLIIAGVWFTSGAQKYSVNTAIWGPGGWLMAKNEAEGYIWLKQNLPINTRVFPFSIAHANRMAGLDMESCEWCPEVIQFREYLINKTPDPMEAYNFLRSEGYEYAIIDAHYAEQLGANETNELISSLIASGLFQPVKQTQTTIAFKLL